MAGADKGKSKAIPTGVPQQIKRPDLNTPAAWQEDAEEIYDYFAKDSKKALNEFEPPAHKPAHVASFRDVTYDFERYELRCKQKTASGKLVHFLFRGVSQKIASEFRRLNRERRPAVAFALIQKNSDHAPVLRPLAPPRRHLMAVEVDKLDEGDTVFFPSDLSQNLEAWSYAGPGEVEGEVRLVRQSESDDTQWEEIVVQSESVGLAEEVLEELSGAVQNRETGWPEFQADAEETEGMAEYQESAPQTPVQGQKPGEADRPTAERETGQAAEPQVAEMEEDERGATPTNRPPGQGGAV